MMCMMIKLGAVCSNVNEIYKNLVLYIKQDAIHAAII